MELSNLLWDGVADDIPSHVTVLDWAEKCGLSITKGSLGKRTAREAYSLIIDNSITMCGQELHLELKTSSAHPGHPHKHADISVVRMAAGNRWSYETTRRELDKTMNSLGRRPDYVVCDNGRTMCKASEGMDIPTHRDISHSFGMFLERVYSKDSEFTDFISKKGYARKFSHTPMAPLMPLHLRVSTIEDCRSFNAAKIIGKATLDDVKKWRADNLLPNPSIKRLNLLKNVS